MDSGSQLDTLLSRLGDQVREYRSRSNNGRGECPALRDLTVFTDSVGSMSISLRCGQCGSKGCHQCMDWGKSRLDLDLVADSLHDEVQLVARYLLMLLMERGEMNKSLDDFRRPAMSTAPTEHDEGWGTGDEENAEDVWEEEDDNQGQQGEDEWLSDEGMDEVAGPAGPARSAAVLEPLQEDDDENDDEDDDDSSEEYDFYESPPDVTVDLMSLSRYAPSSNLLKLKTTMLAPRLLRRVRKFTKLHCEHDPDWVLQLLYDASPHLEELQLQVPAKQHLEVVEQMPHLTRLELEYYGGLAAENEYVFRKPLGHHRGLRWLGMKNLPALTTFSLLRAHRSTLEEVWLTVGTWPNPKDDPAGEGWPASCRDLHLQLARVGRMRQLQRLVLNRWMNFHDSASCLNQLLAVRQAVPGAVVQCLDCDSLRMLKF